MGRCGRCVESVWVGRPRAGSYGGGVEKGETRRAGGEEDRNVESAGARRNESAQSRRAHDSAGAATCEGTRHDTDAGGAGTSGTPSTDSSAASLRAHTRRSQSMVRVPRNDRGDVREDADPQGIGRREEGGTPKKKAGGTCTKQRRNKSLPRPWSGGKARTDSVDTRKATKIGSSGSVRGDGVADGGDGGGEGSVAWRDYQPGYARAGSSRRVRDRRQRVVIDQDGDRRRERGIGVGWRLVFVGRLGRMGIHKAANWGEQRAGHARKRLSGLLVNFAAVLLPVELSPDAAASDDARFSLT
ncbi:hypothetical protein B0H16DRAFT_1690048 [Mycena metata]|uniref:Uncharacterized protein n=1 Tax=Mycena metata TaxID=1033252 RepID=A0AAD7J5Z1_9AGAR|nr:hypothetical protein B0H16DRAFT_1690048 [Mycena metata]